jgi:2-C-methyl-D-erythritol 2,4-cyclodiphosphate synthase
MRVRTGIGQDSHRFDVNNIVKPLVLGGVSFSGEPPLEGNSDADVVLHALTNAISGVTGVNVLGAITDHLCQKQGITDSHMYVQEALKYLDGWQIGHASFTIEAKRPKISSSIIAMKLNIAKLLHLEPQDVSITATSGEGLTAFGRGEGIQVFCIVTATK